MAETVYQKGSTPEDDSYKNVLYARRRDGGIEFVIANSAGGDIDYRVEAASGDADTTEVPDWDGGVTVVATGAGVSANAATVVEFASASAVHTHYRVALAAAASGTPGDFVLAISDGQA